MRSIGDEGLFRPNNRTAFTGSAVDNQYHLLPILLEKVKSLTR
jgi:hypothetical protein